MWDRDPVAQIDGDMARSLEQHRARMPMAASRPETTVAARIARLDGLLGGASSPAARDDAEEAQSARPDGRTTIRPSSEISIARLVETSIRCPFLEGQGPLLRSISANSR